MKGSIILPNVSIVVIGFNEAVNLHATFDAIKKMNYPVEKIELIYVDSGSDDGSVSIAKKYTDKFFIEDRYPSPGRNRNRGLMEAIHEIVHFIDGDVEIDTDYLRKAIPLFTTKNVQAILGKLDERNPNFFNRMAIYSNSGKGEGYALFTATGATYLRSALLSVEGYDERIRRGQETELGQRFRKAGYRIWRTNHKMGRHDFGIKNIWAFLRTFYVNGKSMAQVSLFADKGIFFRQTRSMIVNQHLKMGFYIFLVAYTTITQNYYPIIFSFVFLLIVQNRSNISNIRSDNWQYTVPKIFFSFIGQFYFYFGILTAYLGYRKNATSDFYKLEKMKLF